MKLDNMRSSFSYSSYCACMCPYYEFTQIRNMMNTSTNFSCGLFFFLVIFGLLEGPYHQFAHQPESESQ